MDQHIDFIQTIYEETAAASPGSQAITDITLTRYLKHRFAMNNDIDGVSFKLTGSARILVEGEALQDYSDTVESWRLIQTWASRHQLPGGKSALTHHFTRTALEKLQVFIQAYDLAILRRAGRAALARKQSRIDRKAMLAGFHPVRAEK